MLKKIRPPKHNYILQSLALQDICELHSRPFEERPRCPACLSKGKKFKFSKFDLKFDQCTNCQTIFMNPLPTKDSMDEYYATSRCYEYWSKNIFPDSADARTELICKPSLERIRKELKPYMNTQRSSALEIGPGFGLFASYCAKEKAFSSYEVVEPTPSLAAHAREIGLNTHETNIESFKPNKNYQVVLAFEVLEHIFDPYSTIKAINNFLDKGGFFIGSFPNGLGFDTQMLGAHCPSVDNEHVNLFSPKGVTHLFNKNGFEIISITTPGKMDVEIISEFINREPGVFACEKEFKSLLSECGNSKSKLQNKISKEIKSGHMWVFAKKSEG